MKIDIETKKYLKRPGKKFGINYYYITLLMDGHTTLLFGWRLLWKIKK